VAQCKSREAQTERTKATKQNKSSMRDTTTQIMPSSNKTHEGDKTKQIIQA
jgi:hypothetical protein